MARVNEQPRPAAGRAPRPSVNAPRVSVPGYGHDRHASALMLLPAVLVLLLTNVYPILQSLYLSVFSYNLSIPNATPRFVGLANYQHLLTDRAFLDSARITLEFVLVAVVVELAVG